MDAESSKALAAFGFLTVLESAEHGLFGGYLVLSPQGRPLEFRCSTPVVASRAQEILYGPTLRPYLFADVIGQSLLAGAELAVEVILTDLRDMLHLGLLRSEMVLLVGPNAAANVMDASLSDVAGTVTFEVGGRTVAAASGCMYQVDNLRNLLHPLAASVDLMEPFERVRAALVEAQLAAQDSAEYGDDRAAA